MKTDILNTLDPEEFEQINVRIAENQEEYITLPAHKTDDGRVVCCFHVTPDQIADMARTGRLWIQLFAQGHINPFTIHTKSPFPQDNEQNISNT